MRKAQALLLAALETRPATGRLGNRLRAWVASPRRRTPLRYAGARVLATWAPRGPAPLAPRVAPGRAFLPRAPRMRRARPTRRPTAMALRVALLGMAGGQGTPAPRPLVRRWAPSPLGALAWSPFKRN
jgi:hypothetical protein